MRRRNLKVYRLNDGEVSMEKPKPSLFEQMRKKYGPPPKMCIRGLDFSRAKNDGYCHETCKLDHPEKYQVCQELQLDRGAK